MKEYLFKHQKSREKNLKYDFLPSLIEIVEKPANIWGTVIILFSACLFVSTILWAAFAKFDIVVSANGMITTDTQIEKVEAVVSGQVTRIVVEENDYVKKGDVLVELDTQSVEDTIKSLEYQLDILRLQKDIYTMISDGEDITKLNIEDYGEYKWIVESMIEEEKLYKTTINEYKRQETLGADVEYIQYERKSYEISRNSEIANALAQCELQIWQYEQELQTYKKSLEFYTIKANEAGYVTQLQILSKGEVVSQGDMITYIVDKDELVFECYIADADIADIDLGQTVNVKLSAYPYNDYGVLQGEIIEIEDISVEKENYGNVYVAKVLLKETDGLEFYIGMTGVAEIVIGNRTVLEYFLEPIEQGIRDSFKEK